MNLANVSKPLAEAVDRYCACLEQLPAEALSSIVRSTVVVSMHLGDAFAAPHLPPVDPIVSCLERQLAALADARRLAQDTVAPEGADSPGATTKRLYEIAWGGYSDATFDHAVSLVDQRLRLSGLDETFFAGTRCFDGGCGIGRLSVAIARLGAAEVIAADIGTASLDYVRRQADRLGLAAIKPIPADVTDLSRFPAESFDFVASYGVLHHSEDCGTGLREHFRVLRPGGTFWIYLLGAGGIYWAIYDRIRPIIQRFPIAAVRQALVDIRLREGYVYHYLDCFFAPRSYHTESEVVSLLKAIDPGLSWRRARGISFIDDTDRVLAAPYGPLIIGPEGEVRIVVTKST